MDEKMETEDDCSQDTRSHWQAKDQSLMSPPSNFSLIAQCGSTSSGRWKQAPMCSPGESGYSSYGDIASPFITTGTSGYGSDANTPVSWQADMMKETRCPITGLEEILTKHYKRIKSDCLPHAGNLLDKLFQFKIINQDTFEDIRSHRRSRASDLLIKAISHSLSVGYVDGNVIVDCFETSGNRHLLDATIVTEECHKGLPDDITAINELSEKLKKHEDVFLKGLEPRSIIDDLVQNGMLALSDHEDIYSTPRREERVRFLLNHVEHNYMENIPKLVHVLKSQCPKLWDRFRERENMSLEQGTVVRPLSIETCNTAQFESYRSHCHTDTEMHLKINIASGSTAESTRDVEMAIVDTYNAFGNPALEEEVMEVSHATVEKITFSSIRFHLRCLSKYSTRRLIEALATDTHATLIRKWLMSMLPPGQLKRLKENPITNVTVEVTLRPSPNGYEDCRCLLTRQDLVVITQKKTLELKQVDHIISTLFQVHSLSPEQRKKLQELFELKNGTKKKTDELLTFLLTLPDEFMCLLEVCMYQTGQRELLDNMLTECSAVKSNTTSEMRENADSPSRTRNHAMLKRCTCVTSKEMLVICYSKLTTEVTNVDEILEEMSKYTASKSMENINLEHTKAMEPGKLKTEQFLNLLLNVLPEECICIFEGMIRKTGQNKILSLIEKENQLLRDGSIQIEDIKENFSFIAEEIGPDQFASVLQYANPKLQDLILSNSARLERSKALLRYLVTDGNDNLGEFLKELKRLGYNDVVKVVQSSRNSKLLEHARVKTDLIRQQIMSNFQNFADEVEIENLRTVFVERGITSENEFDNWIEQGATTKERCALLVKAIMRDGYRAMVCFMDGLFMAGYDEIEQQIRDSAEDVQSTCTAKPLAEVRTIMDAEFMADNSYFADIEDDMDDENTGNISVMSPAENLMSCKSPLTAKEKQLTEVVVENEEFEIQNKELQSLHLLKLSGPPCNRKFEPQHKQIMKTLDIVEWIIANSSSEGSPTDMNKYSLNGTQQNADTPDSCVVAECRLNNDRATVEEVPIESTIPTIGSDTGSFTRKHVGVEKPAAKVSERKSKLRRRAPTKGPTLFRHAAHGYDCRCHDCAARLLMNMRRYTQTRTETTCAFGVANNYPTGDHTSGEDTIDSCNWPLSEFKPEVPVVPINKRGHVHATHGFDCRCHDCAARLLMNMTGYTQTRTETTCAFGVANNYPTGDHTSGEDTINSCNWPLSEFKPEVPEVPINKRGYAQTCTETTGDFGVAKYYPTGDHTSGEETIEWQWVII